MAGAVYVVVDVRDGVRSAVSVGRFPQYLEGAPDMKTLCPEASAGTEIHIHLLARNEDCAKAVLDDLSAAMSLQQRESAEHDGFHEPAVQLELIAA